MVESPTRPGCGPALVAMLAAPAIAARRRRARRRRGTSLRVAVVGTGWAGPARWLRARFDVPEERVAEFARCLAGAVADVLAHAEATVGLVRLPAGEEPVLAALAARRDVIAERFFRESVAAQRHLTAAIWLPLGRGLALAELIGPEGQFGDGAQALAELVAGGRARGALRVDIVADAHTRRFELLALAPPALLRDALSVLRHELRRLAAWEAMSVSSATEPKKMVKTTLHR